VQRTGSIFDRVSIDHDSARNGPLEAAVYFLKAKEGYAFRKLEESKWI
jgi:hypothetical protein